MSATKIVWLLTALGFAVLLALAVVRLLAARREVERAKARIAALGDLPVVAALRKAQADVARLQTVSTRVAPLADRARIALAVIRRGPVPPELLASIRLVRGELGALRRWRRH